MLRIPNRQNLLPELYRTEFSVQKIPTCEQLQSVFLRCFFHIITDTFYKLSDYAEKASMSLSP